MSKHPAEFLSPNNLCRVFHSENSNLDVCQQRSSLMFGLKYPCAVQTSVKEGIVDRKVSQTCLYASFR